jgi:acetyl-CoA carboxylase biotin carboxyl carrier protein
MKPVFRRRGLCCPGAACGEQPGEAGISVTRFRISPAQLRHLARLVEENGLSELRYEDGDLRLTLRTLLHSPASSPERSGAGAVATPAAAPVALPTTQEDSLAEYPRAHAAALAAPAAASSVPLARVEAPVMGVFYRAPAPGASPFVEVGDEVEVGQPVGMIEAMKVFSEVLSEVAGRVRECPVQNGALVQPGDTLLVLEEIS